MNTLGIPIRLDRPRTILLDATAFGLLKQATGHDVAATFRDHPFDVEMTLKLSQLLIWGGCVAEDHRLTLEHVRAAVTAENYTTFHDTIAKAILRGLDLSYTPVA